MPRGVLFDIDGTLVDSNRAHAESWAETIPGARALAERFAVDGLRMITASSASEEELAIYDDVADLLRNYATSAFSRG